MIKIKRVYEKASRQDGYRVLVDRLWPRGVKKSDAYIDEWWKEFAPSSDLRNWFGHRITRWEEFSSKYTMELNENHVALAERIEQISTSPITLVYAAKDKCHNNAVVLQQYIRLQILTSGTIRNTKK